MSEEKTTSSYGAGAWIQCGLCGARSPAGMGHVCTSVPMAIRPTDLGSAGAAIVEAMASKRIADLERELTTARRECLDAQSALRAVRSDCAASNRAREEQAEQIAAFAWKLACPTRAVNVLRDWLTEHAGSLDPAASTRLLRAYDDIEGALKAAEWRERAAFERATGDDAARISRPTNPSAPRFAPRVRFGPNNGPWIREGWTGTVVRVERGTCVAVDQLDGMRISAAGDADLVAIEEQP